MKALGASCRLLAFSSSLAAPCRSPPIAAPPPPRSLRLAASPPKPRRLAASASPPLPRCLRVVSASPPPPRRLRLTGLSPASLRLVATHHQASHRLFAARLLDRLASPRTSPPLRRQVGLATSALLVSRRVLVRAAYEHSGRRDTSGLQCSQGQSPVVTCILSRISYRYRARCPMTLMAHGPSTLGCHMNTVCPMQLRVSCAGVRPAIHYSERQLSPSGN